MIDIFDGSGYLRIDCLNGINWPRFWLPNLPLTLASRFSGSLLEILFTFRPNLCRRFPTKDIDGLLDRLIDGIIDCERIVNLISDGLWTLLIVFWISNRLVMDSWIVSWISDGLVMDY